MGTATHVTEMRVRYAETDQMGVVYHANYLIWCEIGRTEFMRARGAPYAQLEQEGVGLAVTEVTLRCHAPARYDDVVRVETTVSAVKSRSVTFEYVLTRAGTGERLATARTVLVSLDRTGRVAALPPLLRERLAGA